MKKRVEYGNIRMDGRMKSQNISLMIVDENKVFCECLASVITQKGFTVIEQFMELREVLNKIKAQQPDIVLININLPNNMAIELIKHISLELSQTKVIILGLSETESRLTILEYIEAGAKGYISKETSLNDLITIIRLVYQGETFCSPQIAYSIFSRVAELARKRHDRLIPEFGNVTLREIEILQLVSEGLSNKQIAQRLSLSLYTVKNHVHNVLEKLQARNRLEAVNYALDKGLLRKTRLR